MTQSTNANLSALITDQARRMGSHAPDACLLEAADAAVAELGAQALTAVPEGKHQAHWQKLRRALTQALLARLDQDRSRALAAQESLEPLVIDVLGHRFGWPREQLGWIRRIEPVRSAVTAADAASVRATDALAKALLGQLGRLAAEGDGRTRAGTIGWLLALEIGLANQRLLMALFTAPASAWTVDDHQASVWLSGRKQRVPLGPVTELFAPHAWPAAQPPGQPVQWLDATLRAIDCTSLVEGGTGDRRATTRDKRVTALWAALAKRHHCETVRRHWQGDGIMQALAPHEHRLYWAGERMAQRDEAPEDAQAASSLSD